MTSVHIRYQIKKLKDYLAIKTEMVNHQAIIKDVAAGVDRSWIYYLMLLMAGLITLMGLLSKRVAALSLHRTYSYLQCSVCPAAIPDNCQLQ